MIRISADSTCDLSPQLIEKYGIEIVPLYVNMGGGTYKDGVDASPAQIYEYFDKTDSLATTSAVPAADYIEVFSRLTADGDEVIHINLSSDLSSSYQNATTAAAGFSGVYPIDSQNLSSGSGHLVILAAELASKGHTAVEIVDTLNNAKKYIDSSFLVNTLTYLYKGGRCSGIAKLGANLLMLKPCIDVAEGKMAVHRKYRGRMKKCLCEYAKDKLADRDDIDDRRIFITHSGCSEDIIEAVRQTVAELNIFNEILITQAGCTISSHCGPGTLGVLFFRKSEVRAK